MRPLLASLAVCLFSVHAAGQTVGMLGDWQKIEFEGLEQVDADAIRHALATDLEYQAAARPSTPLKEFLATTERRITEGFRHEGFARAKIAVTFDAKQNKIIVLVNEGSKYTVGDIRIIGNEQIDADQIINALASPPRERCWSYVLATKMLGRRSASDCRTSQPTWVTDSVLRTDSASAKHMWDQLAIAILDAGYHLSDGMRITSEIDDTEKKFHIRIEFTKVPPPATIDKVVVRGLTRHTEQEVLDYLQIAPGQPFEVAHLDEVYERLRDSCRFWTHSLNVERVESKAPTESGKSSIQVNIDVVEYTHVPKLGEPLLPVDEALRKAAYWLQNFANEEAKIEDDLAMVISGVSEEFKGFGVVCYSPKNGLVATVSGIYDELFMLDHSVIARKNDLTMYSGLQKRRLSLPGQSQTFTIRLVPTHFDGTDFRGSLRVGFGVSTNEDANYKPLDLAVEPVAMVHNAHRKGIHTALDENGKLQLSDEHTSLTIDSQTGKIFEARIGGCECVFRPNAFEDSLSLIFENGEPTANDYDPAKPALSLARFAMADALQQPLVSKTKLSAPIQHAYEWLHTTEAEALVNDLRVVKNDAVSTSDKKFSIPPTKLREGAYLSEGKLLATALADKCFPRGSWPWTLMREYCLNSLANDATPQIRSQLKQGGDTEFWQLVEPDGPGPLGTLYTALSLAENGAKTVPTFARYGTSQLTDEAFLRDISPFIDGDHWVPQSIDMLVRHCHELDDAKAQSAINYFPESLRGAANSLIARRKTQPDENPREALRAVLLQCFRETWRDQMKAEFVRLANPPDDLVTQPPLGPYPSTGIGPNDPWQIAPLAPPTERYPSTSLPGSLAEPATASETWQGLELSPR